MRTLLISCETLRGEIELLEKRNRLEMDAVWLEPGLHDTPDKLHALLQNHLESISDYDRVILGMGRCGGALNQLKTGNYEMILPKADDCISVFFGSDKLRYAYGNENASIFLTEGWALGERSFATEFQSYIEDYDEETALCLLETMYGNFRTLTYIDTGAYDVQKLMAETCAVARRCKLCPKVVPADLSLLEKTLAGPWDESLFYIVSPHGMLQF